jgi:hypothetical protein
MKVQKKTSLHLTTNIWDGSWKAHYLPRRWALRSTHGGSVKERVSGGMKKDGPWKTAENITVLDKIAGPTTRDYRMALELVQAESAKSPLRDRSSMHFVESCSILYCSMDFPNQKTQISSTVWSSNRRALDLSIPNAMHAVKELEAWQG